MARIVSERGPLGNTAAHPETNGVEVRGPSGDGTILHESARQSLPAIERTITYDCASEGRRTGRWRGIPLVDLLTWAAVGDDVTHLLVESADGHAACIPVEDAVGGLLAFDSIGMPGADGIDDSHDGSDGGCPRLLAPGLAAARTVKTVRRITAFRCHPNEDPWSMVDPVVTDAD